VGAVFALCLVLSSAPRSVAPLFDDDQALARAIAARGVPAGEVVVAFAGTTAIRDFARAATAGASGPTDAATRLYDRLLAWKREGRIIGDREDIPKARSPKTAADVFRAALDPKSKDRIAGCYELAVLYVAAARAVGLPAQGVKRTAETDSGQIGHVLAGVRAEDGEALTTYDLQKERRGPPLAGDRVLGDLEFAAHHYNHLAVAAFLAGHLSRARELADWLVLLAPDTPDFLANRATVLIAQGEAALAHAEAVHAVELAPRVPVYRYVLAKVLIAEGEGAAARAQLVEALRLFPGYEIARRDLAALRD